MGFYLWDGNNVNTWFPRPVKDGTCGGALLNVTLVFPRQYKSESQTANAAGCGTANCTKCSKAQWSLLPGVQFYFNILTVAEMKETHSEDF